MTACKSRFRVVGSIAFVFTNDTERAEPGSSKMPFGTGKKRCPSPCHAENGLRQKFCVKCSRSFVEASEMRKMAKRAKMLQRGREMHQRNVSTILNGIQAKMIQLSGAGYQCVLISHKPSTRRLSLIPGCKEMDAVLPILLKVLKTIGIFDESFVSSESELLVQSAPGTRADVAQARPTPNEAEQETVIRIGGTDSAVSGSTVSQERPLAGDSRVNLEMDLPTAEEMEPRVREEVLRKSVEEMESRVLQEVEMVTLKEMQRLTNEKKRKKGMGGEGVREEETERRDKRRKMDEKNQAKEGAEGRLIGVQRDPSDDSEKGEKEKTAIHNAGDVERRIEERLERRITSNLERRVKEMVEKRSKEEMERRIEEAVERYAIEDMERVVKEALERRATGDIERRVEEVVERCATENLTRREREKPGNKMTFKTLKNAVE
ncbi:hypothetical protein CAPTEDRAFT_194923 [Capitella teleta]|uniref:Uncharacterized protein n=1 Tax=Capitella teleta TaxID=283909 RepID=R7TV22_CAPTE|nr:hypothetical protein CAPTEDRAFT_194923 [Capitella teleta]|eukprot:ELT97432.1 hypothetical protein CAPTEDRAFT_194923 [Capitella teleta]